MTEEQFGRYQIKGELGRGGMATVYLAYDPRFKRNVAIKVLPRQFTHDPTFRARFEREAQTIASLEHLAIVPVYDFGEEDGQPYLVMRYMPGGSLADRLGKGALTVAEAIKIVERIGSALDEAHEKGIVHRDLKPGNILFDHHGDALLSDFGIVKLAEATTTFTGGAIIGTPAYMSPEQVHGEKQLDGRSDLYTLGAILFEVLTGQTPYQADTPTKMMMAHVLNPVPHILEVKHDLPAGYGAVIERAMAKKRDERYGTASELIRDLVLATRGEPLSGIGMGRRVATEILPQEMPPAAWASASVAKERRFSNRVWIGAVVVLALFLGGGGILLSTDSRNDPEITPVPGLTVATEIAIAELTLTLSVTSTPTALPTSTTQPTSTPANTRTPTRTPTASGTPSPTDTVAVTLASEPLLRVITNSNVRSGPGTNYGSIAILRVGDVVSVLARTRNELWYNVELSDSTRGWVAASVTEPVDATAMANVSVAATIPAPPPTNTVTSVSTHTPHPTNAATPIPTNTLPPPNTQPTSTSTSVPTEPSTPAPTEPSTPLPTEPPTPLPTEPSTPAPTEPPTPPPPEPPTSAHLTPP